MKLQIEVLGHVNISGHWRPQWMMMDDNDGQMIFGYLGGLKLPDICLTGEEKLWKNLTQETCPYRGSNPGPLRDRRACYILTASVQRLLLVKICDTELCWFALVCRIFMSCSGIQLRRMCSNVSGWRLHTLQIGESNKDGGGDRAALTKDWRSVSSGLQVSIVKT